MRVAISNTFARINANWLFASSGTSSLLDTSGSSPRCPAPNAAWISTKGLPALLISETSANTLRSSSVSCRWLPSEGVAVGDKYASNSLHQAEMVCRDTPKSCRRSVVLYMPLPYRKMHRPAKCPVCADRTFTPPLPDAADQRLTKERQFYGACLTYRVRLALRDKRLTLALRDNAIKGQGDD